MSTASITHHPVPIATAAAAGVAVLAFGVLVVTQNDTSTAPVTHQTTSVDHGTGNKHAGGLHVPAHGGTVQLGQP